MQRKDSKKTDQEIQHGPGNPRFQTRTGKSKIPNADQVIQDSIHGPGNPGVTKAKIIRIIACSSRPSQIWLRAMTCHGGGRGKSDRSVELCLSLSSLELSQRGLRAIIYRLWKDIDSKLQKVSLEKITENCSSLLPHYDMPALKRAANVTIGWSNQFISCTDLIAINGLSRASQHWLRAVICHLFNLSEQRMLTSDDPVNSFHALTWFPSLVQ